MIRITSWRSGKREVNLEEAGCYMTVTVTKDDPQLKSLCEAMNQRRDLEITYVFGDSQEQLTGELYNLIFKDIPVLCCY